METLPLRHLTTLLCRDLLAEPGDSPHSYIAIDLSLRSLAAQFRISCDGASAATALCLDHQHCLGSHLQAMDGSYWDAPQLTVWTTLEDCRAIYTEQPEPRGWHELLALFATVEFVWRDPATGFPSSLSATGKQLAGFPYLGMMLEEFD